ncbi:MAG: (d)CMP kinase [Fibrobacterota bacterium]
MTRKMRISFRREARTQRVLLDGEDITGEIRTPEVTAAVSDYCAVPVVREILVELQRKTSESGPVVLEGRDIGTVVFPDAEFKFYMVASDKARAERRRKDFEKTGVIKTVEEIQKELIERDRKDSSREHSPLKKSDDAVVIDTTGLGIEEQVSLIIEKVLKETAE